MIRHIYHYLLLIVLIAFGACSPRTNPVSEQEKAVQSNSLSQQTQPEEQVADAEAENPFHPVIDYRSAEDKTWDLIHTRLEISFAVEDQQVLGSAELDLSPHFYSQDSLVLDAKSFTIHEVSDRKSGSSIAYGYDGEFLTLDLDSLYGPSDTAQLKIRYTAKPTERQTVKGDAISSDQGIYFIDPMDTIPWKPTQIWTQGEPEANSCWFPTIDAPNQKTTQEMFITVDSSWKTLSNGELIYSRLNEDGTRTDFWEMDMPHAPYLFAIAAGKFAVFRDQWKDIPVHYYVEPEYEAHAEAVFGNTPLMLSYFSDLLQYPFPWKKYHQVVVRDFVSGAMENTTASIFMEDLQITTREAIDQNWDDIIAHELFHQWFGDLVTCESWSQLTLNEGFATLSEYLWQDHQYGRDFGQKWHYEELQTYLREAEFERKDLIRRYFETPDDMFDSHSYAKGGLVLLLLRQKVGDEAFFAALNHYLTTNAYESVEVHDLRLAFEEVTGMDLSLFFQQWFLSSGHPELRVEDNYEEGWLNIQVSQLQNQNEAPLFALDAKIGIVLPDSIMEVDLRVDEGQELFQIPVTEEPLAVVFDWQGTLIGKIQHPKSVGNLIAQFERSQTYRHKVEALQLLASNYFLPRNQQTIHEALDADFQGIRQVALSLISEKDTALSSNLASKIKNMARQDPAPLVRSDAVNVLINFGIDDTEFYYSLIQDSALSVAGAAFYGYILYDGSRVEQLIEEKKESQYTDFLLPVAFYYDNNSRFDQLSWIIERSLRHQGSDRWIFLQLAAQLMLKAPEEVKKENFDRVKAVYGYMDSRYDKYYGYQLLLVSVTQPAEVEFILQVVENERDPEVSELLRGLLDLYRGE